MTIAFNEAIVIGDVTTTAIVRAEAISPAEDVDLYRLSVTANETIDIDVDTFISGSNGLGAYLRLFNAQGQQLAFNSNTAAPGESQSTFQAYLRYTFSTAGTYYVGISNLNNTSYNPTNGTGDVGTGQNATGNYEVSFRSLPVDLDDTLSESTNLGDVTTTPLVINDRIDPDIDVDLFRFRAVKDQIVDFDIDTTLNGPGGLGSYLRLFNAQGQQLAFNDDGVALGESVLGYDSYLRTTIPTTGTYYLGVSNLRNNGYDPTNGSGDTAGGAFAIGEYRLTIRAFPEDVGRTLNTAENLGDITNSPISRIGIIDPANDLDIYQFRVTAGQVVDFDIDTPLNGGSGLGSYLRLFNAQGQQLAANNDAAAPGESVIGFDAYLRYTFTSGGTYYVGVSNVNNTTYNPSNGNGTVTTGTNATGDYQLNIQLVPTDPDDTFTEAKLVGAVTTTGAIYNDSISSDIDVDMYRFTVTAGQYVDFDVDTPLNGPNGLGSYLRLFNAQGQQLNFNDDGIAPGETMLGFDAYLRKLFLTAGTYYLGVSNFNNTNYDPEAGTGDVSGNLYTVGSYTLTIRALALDPDDTLSEATLIGPLTSTPTLVDGTLDTDIDVDIYRFAVTVAGQTIDFDLDTISNGENGLNAYLRIFNNQGTELATSDNAAAPGESITGFDPYLRFTFPTNGTYYIAVSNRNNVNFSATNGETDNAGGFNTVGDYQLVAQRLASATLGTLSLTIDFSSISEKNGLATATLTRQVADISASHIVQLTSTDPTAATVPDRVTIPANQMSVRFEILSVDDTVVDGPQITTIIASANGFVSTSKFIVVEDNERSFYNATRPLDVDNNGIIEPIDALYVINALNQLGVGPILNLEAVFPGDPLYVNTNNDDILSPLDALNVINSLNGGSGEPEMDAFAGTIPAGWLGGAFNAGWEARVDGFFETSESDSN